MPNKRVRSIRQFLIIIASAVTMTGAFAVRQADALNCVAFQICGNGSECGNSGAVCESHIFRGCLGGASGCTMFGCGGDVPSYYCTQLYPE